MSEKEMKIYNSILHIEEEMWSRFVNKRYFLTYHYLLSLERSCSTIGFRYIVYFEEDEIKAVAYFQLLPFRGRDLYDYIPNKNRFLTTFFKKILSLIDTDLLVLGNVVFTCENGILISDEYKGDKNSLIADFIEKASNSLPPRVRGMMISENITKGSIEFFKNKGFHSFRVEDRMEMDMSSFDTFAVYKNALASKYRVRLNKIYKLNLDIEIIDINSNNYSQYHEQIINLFKNVLEKSKFNISKLDENYFEELLTSQKRFKIDGYIKEGKLIGFISYFHLESIVEVHYIGLDYKINDNQKTYNYILYKMIEVAVNNSTKKICYSRTSQELKSTLGAYPVEVFSYLKINKIYLNCFAAFFLNRLTPKTWIQRNPFKIMK